MKHGMYIGPDPDLKNETALLRDSRNPGMILAQFDNIERFGRNEDDLAFGWHEFRTESFRVIPTEE